MATRRKLRNLSLLQRERLSEETPHAGDAIVCSHGKKNHEKPAEMTGCFCTMRNANNTLYAKPSSRLNFEGLFHSDVELKKFSLIDLDAEMQTGRKQAQAGQRERLSERTSHVDDATVWSASNMKMQKSAEMADSFRDDRKSNNPFKPSSEQMDSDYSKLLSVCCITRCRSSDHCEGPGLARSLAYLLDFRAVRAIMRTSCASAENAKLDLNRHTVAVPSVPMNAEINGALATSIVTTWRNENHDCRRRARTAKRSLSVRRTRSSLGSFALASANRRPTGRVIMPRIVLCSSQEPRNESKLGALKSRRQIPQLTRGCASSNTSRENTESAVSSTIRWFTIAVAAAHVANVQRLVCSLITTMRRAQREGFCAIGATC